MRLSKFIKTTGLALSFVISASIYADKPIVELWWNDNLEEVAQKVTEVREKYGAFKYYIQDVDTLVWFLENYSVFIDGDCVMSEGCLLFLLTKICNSSYRESVKAIVSDAIESEKIREFVCALQTLISKKESNQPYLPTPDWNKITTHYGVWTMDNGEIVSVDSEDEETKFKERMSADPKFAGMVRVSDLRRYSRCRSETASGVPSRQQSPGLDDDDEDYYRSVVPANFAEESFVDLSETAPTACNANISDLQEHLSEAGEMEDVFPILYDLESYEAVLKEMRSNPESAKKIWLQSERRDRSQPSSAVPSRNASPEL